tara:strand:+ start:846 stop:1100 length:255 start_codon:yes stop_codon:yes gene_type:complete
MSEHKRFIISIPYYAEDVSEVREAVKKLAEAIDVPYASIHSQCSSDNYKTIFLEEVETEINEEILTDVSGLLADFLKTNQDETE